MIENFDQLRETVLSCKNCKLHETRTNVVFGVGNPHAKVMFIGEGPGENEDLEPVFTRRKERGKIEIWKKKDGSRTLAT